jgi:hypothetical protein
MKLFKFSYKKFSDKLPHNFLNEFKIKFDRTTDFNTFYQSMIKNIDLIDQTINNSVLKSNKLIELINQSGVEKTKEEIEVLANMAKIKQEGDVRDVLLYIKGNVATYVNKPHCRAI